MKKVFVAGKIPQIGMDMLEKEFDVDVYEKDDLISKAELCERMKEKDALLSLLSTPVDKETIDSAPNLKIIANFGAGFNNIDCEYAGGKGISVTNTPQVSTAATADLTIALVLAVARRVAEGDQLARTVGFNGWAPLFFLGREVTGKKLGIVGLGNIGRAVAERAKGFGMEILYNSKTRKSPEVEKELNATFVSLEELLQESDFVAINCSYSPDMKHMFGKEQFHMMKSTAYLINASRGPIVDELALIEALNAKEIEGAALDVFEFEPKISEELKTLKNVVLTPHIGNATIETRDAMAVMAVENIISVLNGREPLNPVNKIAVLA
jgi:D-3-phosphoglycerate dehydrogenase